MKKFFLSFVVVAVVSCFSSLASAGSVELPAFDPGKISSYEVVITLENTHGIRLATFSSGDGGRFRVDFPGNYADLHDIEANVYIGGSWAGRTTLWWKPEGITPEHPDYYVWLLYKKSKGEAVEITAQKKF